MEIENLEAVFPSTKIKQMVRQEDEIGRVYASAVDAISKYDNMSRMIYNIIMNYMNIILSHKLSNFQFLMQVHHLPYLFNHSLNRS